MAHSCAMIGRIPLEAVLASSRRLLMEASAGAIPLIKEGRLGLVVRGSSVVAISFRI